MRIYVEFINNMIKHSNLSLSSQLRVQESQDSRDITEALLKRRTVVLVASMGSNRVQQIRRKIALNRHVQWESSPFMINGIFR